MVSRRVPGLIKSIVLVISLQTLGAGVEAHAEECLSAPDSPSPQGTHWRYRLDWPTQRKCWYLAAPARSLRRAAAAAPATAVLFGRRHSVDVPPKSVDPADPASPSSNVDMLPIDPPTSEGITARGGKLLHLGAPEDISALGPIGTPVPQASMLSQSGDEVTWPDPAGAAVQAQNRIAIPTRLPADSASLGARMTHNAGNSMATILAILALLLAALCVVAKNSATRRAPTIIDQREPDDQRQHDWRGGQGQRRSIDEGQLLVSALSDCGLIRNEDVPFETAFEIRKRKDKLARLHQNLDRLLQSPTTA
jgi:hypothetical protein